MYLYPKWLRLWIEGAKAWRIFQRYHT